MIRLLFHLAFFAAPFVLFWAYAVLAARYRSQTGRAFHRSAPYWVALTGFLLFALSFFVWWAVQDISREGTYVPPRYEDGRIIPGHTVPDESAQ